MSNPTGKNQYSSGSGRGGARKMAAKHNAQRAMRNMTKHVSKNNPRMNKVPTIKVGGHTFGGMKTSGGKFGIGTKGHPAGKTVARGGSHNTQRKYTKVR
jgi:hypothetical protein